MRAGLSLDQAPRFSVPLRFYLTAPLFLAAAGLLAAWPETGTGDWHWAWTRSRWHPDAIALTHLLALGYLSLVMLGSLAQMLPVLAGAPLPASLAVSRFSHGALTLGLPPLLAGMLTQAPGHLLAGTGLVSLGLAVHAGAVAIALARARASPTVWAMRLALLGLALLLPMGVWLATWLAGLAPARDPVALVGAHAAAGLLVWVGALVVGVSYQVVPMLQVTPNYPSWLARWLVWALTALALGWMLANLTGGLAGWPGRLSTLALAAGLAVYALITLDLQRRRKRRLGDATLGYWRLAMASLLLACGVVALRPALHGAAEEAVELLLGLLFLLGFAVGVVNGMLLKIVPFLAWFHLNAQHGLRQNPSTSMKDFISERHARRQLRLHLAAVALLLPSPWLEILALPGGLALAAASAYLGWLLWRVRSIFLRAGGQA